MKAHIIGGRMVSAAAVILAAAGWAVSAAFAGDASSLYVASQQVQRSGPDRAPARFYLTPGIHQRVMDELIHGEHEDATAHGNGERAATQDQGQAPSSMLWPAYKFLPQISHSFTA